MIAEAEGPPALCELLVHHPRGPQQAAAKEPQSSKGHPCPGYDHLCFPIPVLGRGCGPCRAALSPSVVGKGQSLPGKPSASESPFIYRSWRETAPRLWGRAWRRQLQGAGAAKGAVIVVGGLEEVQRLGGVCLLETRGSSGKLLLHLEMAIYDSVDRGKYKEMAAPQDEVKGRGDSPWDGKGWLCVERLPDRSWDL